MLSPFFLNILITPDRKRSKPLLTIENADKKLQEKVFLIAICRRTGDKWQSQTLFLTIFDLHLLIVLLFSVAAYQVCRCNVVKM